MKLFLKTVPKGDFYRMPEKKEKKNHFHEYSILLKVEDVFSIKKNKNKRMIDI